MKSYLFSCGDSGRGPVGFCARVEAETPEEALALLREALPEEVPVPIHDDQGNRDGRFEYVNVYLSAENVTLADIDEGETEEVEPEGASR
jgi:hypothetical protein